MSKQQSLEPIKHEVGFLDLIEKVVTNPDISVDKVRALLDMQLQMEDRRAKADFDAAMNVAQSQVQALAWDKANPHTKSNYVSYPKIDRMLRPVYKANGFAVSFDTEPSANAGEMIMACDVSHTGGHTRRYRLPMPIDGSGPKGGGVMTGPQAVGNGTSYGMRYLVKMIWNIPVLVDKDDTDGNENYEKITPKQVADLESLADEVKGGRTKQDEIKAFCDYFKIDAVENLPASMYKSAVSAFERKRKAA